MVFSFGKGSEQSRFEGVPIVPGLAKANVNIQSTPTECLEGGGGSPTCHGRLYRLPPVSIMGQTLPFTFTWYCGSSPLLKGFSLYLSFQTYIQQFKTNILLVFACHFYCNYKNELIPALCYRWPDGDNPLIHLICQAIQGSKGQVPSFPYSALDIYI